MDTWSELAVEHLYTQVLIVTKPSGDEQMDIQRYINDALNDTGIVFYKAHLYKSDEGEVYRYTIHFFLFSSDTMYWSQTVKDKVKKQCLNKLVDKHANIKLDFEETTEMVHDEKKTIRDVESPIERSFKSVDGNNPVQKFFNWWLIVPRTEWDFLDLPYQLYTFDIFHQYYLTKLFHFVTVPFNGIGSMCFLAQFELGMEIGHAAFSINGAFILFLLLALVYVVVGFVRKAHHWAFASVFVFFVCWMVGNLWYFAYKTSGNPWYNPTTVFTNPILWSYISSFIQALSHGLEPQAPPYYTGRSHWETTRAFCVKSSGKSKYINALFMVFAVICVPIFPTSVSWMAWPHLIGAEVISVMVRLGYKPEAFKKYFRVLEKATLAGNPILNYYPTKPEDLLHGGKVHLDRLCQADLITEKATSSEVVKTLSTLKICDHYFSESSEEKIPDDSNHI